MHPRLVARIARWAAVAALLIVVAVAILFVHRERQAARALRHAPAPVPASVAQRSLNFTFSKVEGQQTVFTVRAARATEFNARNQSLLEDVDIVVFGRQGERHDEIHTRSCDYVPSTGGIICHGDVRMDLTRAPVPGQSTAAPSGGIHIETRNLGFNRDTGDASTSSPVVFRFPRGQGSAVGVTYFSRQSDLQLHRDVQLTLMSNGPAGSPTYITAASLSYNRATQSMRFTGPVRIAEGARSLQCAALTMGLDNQMRPRRALAGGRPIIRIAQTPARLGDQADELEADKVEVLFDAAGRAQRVNALGNVVAIQRSGAGASSLQADRASVTLDPAAQEARDVQADGNVRFASKRGERSAELTTATLRLSLKAGRRPGVTRLDRAEAPETGTASWSSRGEQLQLTAGQLAASFDNANQLQLLQGTGGVHLRRQVSAGLPVVTSADNLQVNFATGQWVNAEETGHVRAKQGTRVASAGKARWIRATDFLNLRGDARVSDPTSQTLADSIDWNQQSGQFHAAGNVRSSYVAATGGKIDSTPSRGPANIAAQTLDGSPSAGEAVYGGGARFWQGDLVIQADKIQMDRNKGVFTAFGNVLAAFPQTQTLWRVRAQKLTYANQPETAAHGSSAARNEFAGQNGQATLEGGVVAVSSQGQIDAQSMVLHMSRNRQGRAELAQALGLGGVTVRQAGRWGQAEQGVYDAATGRFVLSQGHPALHDASGDVVTGDQLTFYEANDTILVESAEGSRTLTKHPVPK